MSPTRYRWSTSMVSRNSSSSRNGFAPSTSRMPGTFPRRGVAQHARGAFHLCEPRSYVKELKSKLEVHEHPEAAERHSLAVERHRLRIHHVREPRILHRLRVHPVAILARFVDDPREPDFLALLELHALRERHLPTVHHVVGDALVI